MNSQAHFKSLQKELKTLAYAHTLWEVWRDFLDLSFFALNSWKRDERNEEAYLSVTKRYKPEDLHHFARGLAIVVEAFEGGLQDFLGFAHMALELGNAASGQFFTPYCICALMAESTIPERPTRFPVTISDPACGSGANLIAAIEHLFRLGVPQEHIYVEGTDIDHRAFRMASIQLTLCGVPARVIHGNSISGEIFEIFETLQYWSTGMQFRLRRKGHEPEHIPPAATIEPTEAKGLSANKGQMDLFGGAA